MDVFLVTALVILAFCIYHYFTSLHSYWKNKGVKGPKPTPFFGSIRPIVKKQANFISISENLYKQYPDEKVVGLYQGYLPTLLIRDPDIARTVLIKDFHAFVNRGIKISNEPLNRHLFAADGDEWKMLRQKLSPIFTTGKLKNMMPLLNTCVEQYMQYLDKLVQDNSNRDLRVLNMKYTMKTITSVAFGLEVNTFVEEKTDFELMASQIFKPSGLRRVAFLLNNIWPGIIDKLHISTSPAIADFFMSLVKSIVREREGKPKVRRDFMDLLIEMKEEGKLSRVKDDGVAEIEITDELITAQAIVFYAAGFETSSGVMTFLLYELAKQPEIQDKCFKEVKRVMEKYKGKLDYDALKELSYLSMVMDEALRKYPIAAVLLRQSVTEYTFKDLDLTIKKGTKILIPVQAIHMDEKYFPDPEKFDPDRFAPENKESFKHEYYMPFGDGPRNCIGLRFARVQSLLGLAHLIYNFSVAPCEETPKKIVFDIEQVTLSSLGGLWLNIQKRK